tara:strand:+ start:3377 stop:3895 length:519 start_codon:yes stop_codon:yes gene_type:complete
MGVLPSNYQVPKSGNGGVYVKLEPGENRFRMLEAPTTGFIVWKDKKPTRYKAQSDVPAGSEDVKHFWFFPVWMNEKVCFIEIAQKTVISELAFLDQTEDWGALTDYDVLVNRDGDGMETQYRVQPVPKRALKKDALKEWESMKPHYKPEQLFTDDGVVYKPVQNDADEELPF